LRNLSLWKKVEKTPQEIKVAGMEDGFYCTTVPAINRLKVGTELFGVYGDKWGLKKIKHSELRLNDSEIIGICEAVFYAQNDTIKTKFKLSVSVKISTRSKDEIKVDGNYRKSLETSLISKALSRLGVFADIYTDGDVIQETEHEMPELIEIGGTEIEDN
jgi:hypothetical protein